MPYWKLTRTMWKNSKRMVGRWSFWKRTWRNWKKGEGVTLAFTSLCRFPVYEADFAWGKTVWIGSAKLFNKNIVTFLDTKSGNGIEAWINLEEEEMAKFGVDKELLLYISSAKVDVWQTWMDNRNHSQKWAYILKFNFHSYHEIVVTWSFEVLYLQFQILVFWLKLISNFNILYMLYTKYTWDLLLKKTKTHHFLFILLIHKLLKN